MMYVTKEKKRFFAVFLIICITALLFPTNSMNSKAASKPAVHAHAYVISDANTGEILYSQNATKKIYPASTVKLMTALVVLDHCKLSKRITITSAMLKHVTPLAAKAGLRAGDSYTVSALLHMLLLPSAADAATVLAIGSSGSMSAFVKEMNQKANTFQMERTSFDNPIGLDIGDHFYKTYTTAKDFSKLARISMANPTIRSIVAKGSYRVPAAKHKRAFTIRNTNRFVSLASYAQKGYQVIGTKTGTTRAAGSVLIATAKDTSGHEIICAFFGNRSHDQMYRDIRSLLQFTFQKHKNGSIHLTKGYWDVRFRDTETLIQSYCDDGTLPVSNRFYPTSHSNQNVLLSLIHDISGIEFTPENAEDTLSVLTFATLYYNTVSNHATPMCLANVQTTKTATDSAITIEAEQRALLQQYLSNFDSLENCTMEELIALAYVKEQDILPEALQNSIQAEITKEQAVQIGATLQKNKVEQVPLQ